MSRQEKNREMMFSKIRDWQQSGLSQKAFCEQFNITYSHFHYWYKRFRHVDPPSPEGFIPVEVRNVENALFASVIFSGGARVELHQAVNAEYIKELLR